MDRIFDYFKSASQNQQTQLSNQQQTQSQSLLASYINLNSSSNNLINTTSSNNSNQLNLSSMNQTNHNLSIEKVTNLLVLMAYRKNSEIWLRKLIAHNLYSAISKYIKVII